jgi:hypothetical protein
MNRTEMIAELVSHGYVKRSLNKLTDEELATSLLEQEKNLDAISEDIASDSPELIEVAAPVDTEKPVVLCQDDEGWTDYVMSLLTDKEKSEGKYPRIPGLRRMVKKFLGPIVTTTTHIAQCPTPENEQRASVVVAVTVLDGEVYVRADGASDTYWGNTDKPYRNHPVATAETKAEGRALKKLLNIDVLTADEKVDKLEDNILGENVGNISQPQLIHLETLCRDKLNVNVAKLVHKFFPDCHNIDTLRHSDALDLFRTLQVYQQMGVPEEMLGYDSGWKNELKG